MIQESNYDDLALQPGEDREFKNQFTEFLKKNMPVEEPTKKKTTNRNYKSVLKDEMEKRRERERHTHRDRDETERDRDTETDRDRGRDRDRDRKTN